MRAQPQAQIVPAIAQDIVPGMVEDDSNNLGCDDQQTGVSRHTGVMDELDACLAKMFMIPEPAMGPCMLELRRILQQGAAEPKSSYACQFAQYSMQPQFRQLVGQYQPAVALLCLAGFKEDFSNDGGKRFSFVGDPKSKEFSAVLNTLQRLTADQPSQEPKDLDEISSTSCESLVQVGETQKDAPPALSRKPSRLAPLSDQAFVKKQRNQKSASKVSVSKSGSTTSHGRAGDVAQPASPSRHMKKTNSLAANWGVVAKPASASCGTNQPTRPALLSSKEQCKDTTDFDVLVKKALDGTNLHRAKKGLAPLTSLRCSSEETCINSTGNEADDEWTGDVVTIPEDNWTNPRADDSRTRPRVSEGTWTTPPAPAPASALPNKAKASHSVPAIFSGKAKLRSSKGAKMAKGGEKFKASVARQENEVLTENFIL
jgi:hypothetical protein